MTALAETPSGKGASGENFPVASRLVRPELRPRVMAFYNFARAADDVADNPALEPADKIARLDRMEAALDGRHDPGVPAAMAMCRDLGRGGVDGRHCRDLLAAFRWDARANRWRDWQDLLDYCRLSAAPVGRHVLDLHGEDRRAWSASDPLCAALQILNHLQDCGVDRREMDRVYLPADRMAAHEVVVADLDRPAATPGLRRLLDELLDGVDALLVPARSLPTLVRDRRLGGETRAILVLARALSGRLRCADPLAGRVKPGRGDFLRALAAGLMRAARP
jgi:squalene synthase HpnC